MDRWAAAGFKDTLLRCQMKQNLGNGAHRNL